VFPGGVHTPLIDAVLNSKQRSPAVAEFKKLSSNNQLNDPKIVGEFVANILTSATDSQLDERKYWDINCPEDQIFPSTSSAGTGT